MRCLSVISSVRVSISPLLKSPSQGRDTIQIIGKITHRLEKRKEARIKKDFATADKIRENLLLAGVEIKDNEDKTSWKIKDNFIKEKLENL